MTTTNLGRVAIVPKGTYTAGPNKPLDLVRYQGASYLAKTTTSALPTVTTDWDLIASDGAAGSAGPVGATGPQGPAGTNGTTLYTWIKYADDAVGTGLSDSPTGKTYIGIAVNKTTATESTTAGDYTWSLIKGLDSSGTVSSVAALTLTTTGTDLTSTVATGTTTPVITLNVPNASATARGVLSSADWTTFNDKYSTGGALGTPSSGSLANCTNAVGYGLKSATTTISVSAATAPTTGQVLMATSSTTATWQTPSSGGVSTGKAIAMAIVFGG